MQLITASDALAAFCDRLRAAEFVTFDTEFIRERTYWPRLCLVQLAGPDEAAVIDPLADEIDLAPLCALLNDAPVLKVLHSGRQDIEIFFHMTGRVPHPVFDTQLAAMVCGFGDQVSLETLIARLTGQRLDKSSRFTDWARRPLSARQLAYAMADVTHLRGAYEKIRAQLQQNGRARWLEEEVAELTDPETYRPDPAQAWQRLKPRTTDRRFLAILQAVAAWRENEAIARDIPRNRVLRDEALLEVAAHPAGTVEELAQLRGIPKGFAEGRLAKGLLKAIEAGGALPLDEAPEGASAATQRASGPVADLLKVLLKLKCAEHSVAQRLVASAADVERIAADDEAAVPALKGWRREVFGEDAMRLKHGEVALAASNKSVTLYPVEQGEAKRRRRRRARRGTAGPDVDAMAADD